MTRIQPDDNRLSWEGAISVETGDGWVQPWRLPIDTAYLWHDDLRQRASTPAGVRLTFRTDSTAIRGEINRIDELWLLDIVVDGERVGSQDLNEAEFFSFDGLSSHMKTVEIWLPQRREFRLFGLDIDEGASIEPHEDSRPRWVTYGSSITHCAEAASPTQTWPGIVAREFGLHHTNLGFGGQDHLDAVVAQLIRDLPVDFITIKAGVNAFGSGSLNARTFRTGLIGFVQIVREGHPEVPVVVISPTYFLNHDTRDSEPNVHGMSLPDWREEVRTAVDELRAHGDSATHYVSGLDLFSEDDAHLIRIGHPNPEGYRRMGRRFLERVAEPYFVITADDETADSIELVDSPSEQELQQEDLRDSVVESLPVESEYETTREDAEELPSEDDTESVATPDVSDEEPVVLEESVPDEEMASEPSGDLEPEPAVSQEEVAEAAEIPSEIVTEDDEAVDGMEPAAAFEDIPEPSNPAESTVVEAEPEFEEDAAYEPAMAALPVPTARQIDYQNWEMGLFLHFGIRTFYEGHIDMDGKPMSPEQFNPTGLDCDQWARVAKEAGCKYAVMTAKHHDGFANWPSATTDFSVASSSWRDGNGDVVREFVDACRKHDLAVGLYYSPYDWNCPVYEDESAYDDFFIEQISEILEPYGEIDILWFDGCGSEGHAYDWPRIIGEIRRMQPNILLFNMGDPAFRWIGNEEGYAPLGTRNTVETIPFSIHATEGDRVEPTWLPAECDARVRERNWFYSDADAHTVKSVAELVGMWYYSVGRGCNLLLNIGPDRRGRLPEPDARNLIAMGHTIQRRFASPLASIGESLREGDIWEWRFDSPTLVDHMIVGEDISQGERVLRFRIQSDAPEPITVFEGYAVGIRQVCSFPPIATRRLLLEIAESDGTPILSRADVFLTV